MLYGRDLLSMITLVAGWSWSAWAAGRISRPGQDTRRRVQQALAGLAAAACSSGLLATEHLGRLGFYLDDQKRWPGAFFAVLPVIATALPATPRLLVTARTGEDGARAAPALRAGLYGSLALVGFELFPHDRLRPVDGLVPVVATLAASAVDLAVSRAAARRTPPGEPSGSWPVPAWPAWPPSP